MWLELKDAPLETEGLVWGPELKDRTGIIWRVYAYPDGDRNAVGQGVLGIELTHWHPLPDAPSAHSKQEAR